MSIELEEADWDALRSTSRHGLDVLGDTCEVSPASSPYVYYPANVRVGGHEAQLAGVRKKGFFGTQSDEKPSLKVKLDEYADGQRVWG